ncbi:Lsr2 family protein [Micrococcales bacterium 31B]|nr:Lsr2 family protein [Micrococcales bacterium 31B]
MASKVTVQLIDDIDGSTPAETMQFGLDGVQYEIDLSDDHTQELRTIMEKWVRNARRVGRVSSRKAASASTADSTAIRAWAKANGYLISDRGRVSADIREAYAKAN